MPLYFVWGWGRRFRKGLMRKEKVTISRFFFSGPKDLSYVEKNTTWPAFCCVFRFQQRDGTNWKVCVTCLILIHDNSNIQHSQNDYISIIRKDWSFIGKLNKVQRNILCLSLIHIWRCRRSTLCRSRWSPYH